MLAGSFDVLGVNLFPPIYISGQCGQIPRFLFHLNFPPDGLFFVHRQQTSVEL